MRVIEIFDSIDGEGIRAGMGATFIRLAGCNLRCSYCDTLYALYNEAEECKYTEMSAEEITEKVNPKFNRVTLTGGEPLIHEDAEKLIDLLLQNGAEVNIETNGAADITKFIRDDRRLFFTIDYKLPSSGVSGKMLWDNFLKLRPHDVIKFVAGSEKDIEEMCRVISRLSAERADMPQLFAGTVFGKYDPARLAADILEYEELKNVRLQLQIHKYIWNPEKRGV